MIFSISIFLTFLELGINFFHQLLHGLERVFVNQLIMDDIVILQRDFSLKGFVLEILIRVNQGHVNIY